MSLKNALDSPEAAKVEAAKQGAAREAERKRIREKMPPDMREAVDELRAVFGDGVRLLAVKFSDGETIGKFV